MILFSIKTRIIKLFLQQKTHYCVVEVENLPHITMHKVIRKHEFSSRFSNNSEVIASELKKQNKKCFQNDWNLLVEFSIFNFFL